MSEDNNWRQLGAVVNAVLVKAKTQAIRKGALCHRETATAGVAVKPQPQFKRSRLGHGFLSDAKAGRQIQLELPLGFEALH